jgi:hypothetical protein
MHPYLKAAVLKADATTLVSMSRSLRDASRKLRAELREQRSHARLLRYERALSVSRLPELHRAA